MRYCDSCTAQIDPDEQYLVTPAANGVGSPVVECIRHFPFEVAADMVEDMYGLPPRFLADGDETVARGLTELVAMGVIEEA